MRCQLVSKMKLLVEDHTSIDDPKRFHQQLLWAQLPNTSCHQRPSPRAPPSSTRKPWNDSTKLTAQEDNRAQKARPG